MSQSQADQVYELIKNDILTCALRPGQQIAQPQLAERYDAGITPIREALQRLAQKGLVQPVPRFGYIVAPITLADVNAVYELRAILESAAARLAAMRGEPGQIEKIAELANHTYTYKDHESYASFLAHNAEFHRAVAAASGNNKLAERISQTLDELTRVFHLGLDIKDSAEEMRAEHMQLVEALRKRDPDEAERIVRAQVARSRQRVLEALVHGADLDMPGALGQIVQIG
ncbi:MAG: GntR family transcriptional regulator [Anaerolineales bacterium]|nr:GntR family transcriptional regulator [Anaerolineales bacterium]